jgi:type II secretory pathway pseudopilin PulG
MPVQKPIATSERGVTLIETVIVIIVLGLSFAVLIPATLSTRNSAAPVLTQQAAALAQEKLEQIIADRLDQTTPRGFTYATTPGNYPAENPLMGAAGFSRAVTITCVTTANLNAAGAAPSPSCASSDGRTDYARVTVTVTATGAGNVTAVTLLTNR